MQSIMYIAIFIGMQVGLVFMFSLIRKLRKEVKSFKEYMILVNLQYAQQEKIIQATDKDPNTESNTEKIFKYIGKQLETLTDFINTEENEFMNEQEKLQYIQNKIILRVKEVITEVEGDNSDLLNDQLITDVIGYILKFISPFIIKPNKPVIE